MSRQAKQTQEWQNKEHRLAGREIDVENKEEMLPRDKQARKWDKIQKGARGRGVIGQYI